MSFSEDIEAIIDEVVAAIETAVADADPGSIFGKVNTVVRGDRARPMPELPNVWVVPQQATMRRDTYGEETWHLPLSIAGLVKSDDAAEGGRRAQHITARAMTAVMQARGYLRATINSVVDVQPESFDPVARTSEANRALFWGEAVVRVDFSIENEEDFGLIDEPDEPPGPGPAPASSGS